jgi:protein-S-isoprenylcysteine O-methyltransferase Ste14
MTEALAPPRKASGAATALATLFSIVNAAAVLLLALSLAAFRMDYDGEDVLAPSITSGLGLAIIALIIVTTVFGWRGLGRNPWRALLVMGAPGALIASLMIVGLSSAGREIGRMQAGIDRAGWPSTFGP